MSSSSLFEVEIASNLVEQIPEKDSQDFEKSDRLEDQQHNDNQDSDFNQRKGRVYTYSTQGGISSDNQKGHEELQYRLRHFNTGRLVIDQEIEYNGEKLRTLGLAPHLVALNMANLSEK